MSPNDDVMAAKMLLMDSLRVVNAILNHATVSDRNELGKNSKMLDTT